MTFEEFQNLEQEPTEINIPELGKNADYKIENTSSLEELHGKIDQLIRTIKDEVV
jgi:hypothetical protein